MSTYAECRQRVVDELRLFERLIAESDPANAHGLIQQRVKLVQRVNAYITQLGSDLGRATPDVDTPPLRQWRDDLGVLTALRQRYSQHISRWTVEEITLHWSEYRQGSQELIRAMRAHLDAVGHLPPL